MHDIMLDLETWGVAPGSAIRTIGMVRFSREGAVGDTLHLALDCEAQCKSGFRVDPRTEDWWAGQKEADAKIRAMPQVQPEEALSRIVEFVGRAPVRGIWAQGSDFDLPILVSLFWRFGVRVPWKPSVARDTRTVYDLAWGRPAAPLSREGTHHTALDDCRHQVACVAVALAALGRS